MRTGVVVGMVLAVGSLALIVEDQAAVLIGVGGELLHRRVGDPARLEQLGGLDRVGGLPDVGGPGVGDR